MTVSSRTVRRQERRRRVLLAVWLLAGVAILARAAQLQVVESDSWQELAAMQQRMTNEIDAPRGTIYDRDGVPLAVSLERYRIEIDADQLEDPDLVRTRLREALSASARSVAEWTDPDRDWVVVPGRYEPAVRTLLGDLKHVYLYRELRRDYPHQGLAAGVLGRVVDGSGAGGIEQSFDELLRGTPGRSVVARDTWGNQIPGQIYEVEPPRAGGDVHLTLDLDLQEIAYQALREAVETTDSRGGDLVVTDPNTGEILAMVSIEDGRSASLSMIGTPYEPGSTLKPFTVAGLLRTGNASLTDRIDIGNGSWRINGRTLNDTHPDTSNLSLADALRVSSNVGIAKAAQALSSRDQYENLRDFGFGVPTGIALPGEAGGVLYHPREWTGPSPQSMAIGYEVMVTPLQMAMAYGALANGGRLMEARLVRETRAPDDRVTVHAPAALRQVIDGVVADQVGRVLVDVVEDGTGTRAQLETFAVAGKSGTARAYGPNGYVGGRYNASFASYFPADDPQLVIFVKLDGPRGGVYYGGATAAPVTRAIMEASLAARQSPLDRDALLASARGVKTRATPLAPIQFAAVQSGGSPGSTSGSGGRSAGPSPQSRTTMPIGAAWTGPSEVSIPDLSAVPARVAARRLHALGFRVVVESGGRGLTTIPKPGTRWAVGDTVRLRTGRPER